MYPLNVLQNWHLSSTNAGPTIQRIDQDFQHWKKFLRTLLTKKHQIMSPYMLIQDTNVLMKRATILKGDDLMNIEHAVEFNFW